MKFIVLLRILIWLSILLLWIAFGFWQAIASLVVFVPILLGLHKLSAINELSSDPQKTDEPITCADEPDDHDEVNAQAYRKLHGRDLIRFD